jgi:hypothetical protein
MVLHNQDRSYTERLRKDGRMPDDLDTAQKAPSFHKLLATAEAARLDLGDESEQSSAQALPSMPETASSTSSTTT